MAALAHVFGAVALALAQEHVGERIDISASLTVDELVLPADTPAPFLGGHGWVIDGKLATDAKSQLLEWMGRHGLCAAVCSEQPGTLVYVSLGPQPTFEAFLRTAKSLRGMGLCRNVFIKEGGEIGGVVVSKRDNRMPGLDLC